MQRKEEKRMPKMDDINKRDDLDFEDFDEEEFDNDSDFVEPGMDTATLLDEDSDDIDETEALKDAGQDIATDTAEEDEGGIEPMAFQALDAEDEEDADTEDEAEDNESKSAEESDSEEDEDDSEEDAEDSDVADSEEDEEEDFDDDEVDDEAGTEDDEDDEDDSDNTEAEQVVDDTGTEVDLEEEGLKEKEEEAVITESDFIDSSGGIVVQDKDDDGHGFTFAYIDKENIAVQTDSRIHKEASLTALQKSIQNTGILEPLVVAPLKTEGYYILIHGFRRFQAGLREGLKQFPCIINNRIKTNEIPIIEAIYNHTKSYSMKELKEYITYLEKDKGILSASMIEFLCQLNSGDYAKLRDLWDDNDPDIIEKLDSGQFTIQQAFNALEKRRKKETKAEQERKAAEKAYSGGDTSLLNEVAASGDVGDKEAALTEEEIKEMSFDPTKLDDIIEEKNLDDMVEDGKGMEGFEPHKQDPNQRERIDPSIRKAVMSRDNNTCQCCKRGGPDYVDILDLHHIVEVYLGGEDSVENSIALCLNCHKQVHLYAFNKLHIPKTKSDEELQTEVEKEIVAENAARKEKGKAELTDAEKEAIKEEHITLYKNEQNKYKKIIYLGNIIRDGLRRKGMKLEQAKKEHPIDNIGRQKPGIKNTIA